MSEYYCSECGDIEANEVEEDSEGREYCPDCGRFAHTAE